MSECALCGCPAAGSHEEIAALRERAERAEAQAEALAGALGPLIADGEEVPGTLDSFCIGCFRYSEDIKERGHREDCTLLAAKQTLSAYQGRQMPGEGR